MPRFMIEREIPGASEMSQQALQEISARSNAVAAGLGVPYRWIASYVAGDKIYCVHEADSAEIIRRHSREAGFPANVVSEVANIIGPETAKGA